MKPRRDRFELERNRTVVPPGSGSHRVGRWKVRSVDGEWIRDNVDVDFVEGGNPARYGYIPIDEIWIEDNLKDLDARATLLHELVEECLMQRDGLTYDDAHDEAAIVEREYRRKHVKNGRKMRLGEVRELVREIIRKCGDEWCLYTKHKQKNGKRRKLGTHATRAGAEQQEKAIHSHGG